MSHPDDRSGHLSQEQIDQARAAREGRNTLPKSCSGMLEDDSGIVAGAEKNDSFTSKQRALCDKVDELLTAIEQAEQDIGHRPVADIIGELGPVWEEANTALMHLPAISVPERNCGSEAHAHYQPQIDEGIKEINRLRDALAPFAAIGRWRKQTMGREAGEQLLRMDIEPFYAAEAAIYETDVPRSFSSEDREAFERYAHQLGFRNFEADKDGNGGYESPTLDQHWAVWKASRVALQVHRGNNCTKAGCTETSGWCADKYCPGTPPHTQKC